VILCFCFQSALHDPAYRDAVENSASFNTRMSLEKKMRLPFLDAQTGVAQNHCHLWMQPRHRMPGLTADQIYTYPAKLWRKKRRSYLVTYAQPSRKMEIPMLDAVAEVPIPVEVAIPPVQHIINEDSKDSVPVAPSKDETTSKDAWFYEDMQVEAEDFEEPDGDSDFDYEESSAKKRGKAKKDPPKKTPSKSGGRGRKKQIPVNYDATDTEKPYSCETCGARYKTRPGLTYHYTHSHKNLLEDDDEDSGSATPSAGSGSGHNAQPPITPISSAHGSNNSGNSETPSGYYSNDSRYPSQRPQSQYSPWTTGSLNPRSTARHAKEK